MVLLRDPDPKVLSTRFATDAAHGVGGRGLRDYGVGAQILLDLGVREMIALSSSRLKPAALEGYGLTVAERVPLQKGLNPHNKRYLATKAGKLGHMLGELHQGEAEIEAQ